MATIKPNTIHTARTIMFLELEKVMNFSSENDDYLASMQKNVFGKKSQDGIKKTSAFLTKLYHLDISFNEFKVFKYFWSISDDREKSALTLIYALNNDYLLQESLSVISSCKIGEKVELEKLEENIEKIHQNNCYLQNNLSQHLKNQSLLKKVFPSKIVSHLTKPL